MSVLRRTWVVTAVASLVLGAACTGGGTSVAGTPSRSPSSSSVPTGAGSAAAARAALCDVPDQTPPPLGSPPEGGTPDAIAEVEDQVVQERGLDFERTVPVEPLTTAEMATEVRASFRDTFPADQYERRSLAWATLGVIPAGTSLHDELEEFLTGEVLGFYVLETGRLVYIGGGHLSPLAHLILAHELTHAVDDQHFHLEKLDRLVTDCDDEGQTAALGAMEGSAQFYSFRVAQDFLTPDELLEVAREAAASPIPDVAPFISRSQLWPYDAGRSFITALDGSGGTEAVNAALQDFPVSTEQVMHPEKFPSDVPTPVDIPDLAPSLGAGWSDLDVSDVGESFLNIMLGLRLDTDRADDAAAGWDGGIYRGWSNGHRVAVVMQTVWDSPEDARQFADTMTDWIDAGDQPAVVLPAEGTSVRVLFASDDDGLAALRSAA
jgi:hypothetical protein